MSKVDLRYDVTVNGSSRRVRVRAEDPGRFVINMDQGPDLVVEAFETEPGNLTLLADGASWEAGLAATEDGFVVDVLGIPHEVEVVDPVHRAVRTHAGGGGGLVRTQMPGRIVRVLVEEGGAVAKGDPVVVVEAMKMENELKAPREGTVRKVCVQPGDLVEARAVLVELA